MKPITTWSVSFLLLIMPSGAAAFEVLVFSKTATYRHDVAILDGNIMLQKMATEDDWKISFGEESNVFEPKRLATINCIVWNNVSGNVLEPIEREAFRAYINRGGGFVAIHNAVHAEMNWPYYEKTMGGGTFRGHAKGEDKVQTCKINVEHESSGHPITKHFPASLMRNDEWYNFSPNPRSSIQVLLHLDESTLRGPKMGGYHPVTWTNELDGKRVFCTCFGHTPHTFREPNMVEMFRQAILWAANKKQPNKQE